jgi:hypothetical protein
LCLQLQTSACHLYQAVTKYFVRVANHNTRGTNQQDECVCD